MSRPRKANPGDKGCHHNRSIECAGPSPHCSGCGWNPAVQRTRVKAWLNKHQGTKFIVTWKTRRKNDEDCHGGQQEQ